MTETSFITQESRGHLYLIGINRAAKRNAFTWQMLVDFAAAFTAYENDPNARCAVVYAEGDHFTAGLDLADVAPHVAEGQGLAPASGVDPWGINGKPRNKPVVCAVQGYCFTLGIELILASDINIAASNTRFGQIEIKRGIFPFGGATIRMAQIAGWSNAMRYLLTGDEFDATEAYRMGLVQEVVEPGEQLNRALHIAETIAAQAPLGVRATLVSARTSVIEGFHAAVQQLQPTIMELMKTEDAQEGLMSFLERRQGNFKGR